MNGEESELLGNPLQCTSRRVRTTDVNAPLVAVELTTKITLEQTPLVCSVETPNGGRRIEREGPGLPGQVMMQYASQIPGNHEEYAGN